MTVHHAQSTVCLTKIGRYVGAVALSGGTSIHNNPGGICRAGIVFSKDGQVLDLGPDLATTVLFTAGEWYIEEPDIDIGAYFEVRCASITSGAWTGAQAASVGVWIDMSVNRAWTEIVQAMASPDNETCTAIFEIRRLGGNGTILASAEYTANAGN